MSSRKKREAEFQYYEIPHGERLLALPNQRVAWDYGNIQESDKRHFHNLLEIGCCISGSGRIFFQSHAIDYGPGMITVIPQNILHETVSRTHTGSRWDYFYINPGDLLREFYPDNPLFVKRILERVNSREQYYPEALHASLASLVRLINDGCKVRADYSGEYIRGLLLALLTAVGNGGAKYEHRTEYEKPREDLCQISGALEYIGTNYMEHIRLKALADACNLSETHFGRLFVAYMHMTPVEYINLVRIKQACTMIERTDCSMEEAAEQAGYTAVSTFNRNFRKIVGTSPYQYRKNSRDRNGKHVL